MCFEDSEDLSSQMEEQAKLYSWNTVSPCSIDEM